MDTFLGKYFLARLAQEERENSEQVNNQKGRWNIKDLFSKGIQEW